MNVKPMMKKFLTALQNLFGRSPQDAETKSALAMLSMTQEQELSCDEVHNLIDQFAEMQMRGENPVHLFPLVQRHLDMCPDCKEEYEALLVALKIS